MIGGGFPDFNGAATPCLVRLHGDEAIAIPSFSLGLRWNVGLLELGLFGGAGRNYTIDSAMNLSQFTPWTNRTSTGTNRLQMPPHSRQFYCARTTP